MVSMQKKRPFSLRRTMRKAMQLDESKYRFTNNLARERASHRISKAWWFAVAAATVVLIPSEDAINQFFNPSGQAPGNKCAAETDICEMPLEQYAAAKSVDIALRGSIQP